MSKPINFGLLLITLSTLNVPNRSMLTVDKLIQSDEKLLDVVRNKVLERHNYYRKKFRLQPFIFDEEMNDKAQNWANSLALAEPTKLEHDPKNERYGENLAKTPVLTDLGVRVVDIWFSFISHVNVSYGKCGYNGNPLLGPMTQLLWKSSIQIGVGVSKIVNGDYFVVVYYYPQGNIDHWFTVNVPPINLHDVKEGRCVQEYFSIIKKRSILVSNLKLGTLKLPQVLGNYVFPTSLEAYTTYSKARGLRKTEACSIRKKVFEKTNLYRKNHGIHPLVLNEELNNDAQLFANEIANEGAMRSRYVNEIHLGENKFRSSPIIYGDFGEIAVDTWYNQIGLLHENMNESEYLSNRETGCLTQLLWRKSVITGIGVSVDKAGFYYLVVNYYPSGNVENTFLENLPEFKNSEIEAGAEANDELNQLAGEKTEFKEPSWIVMYNQEELNSKMNLQPLKQGLEANLKEPVPEPNIKEPVPDPNLKEPVPDPNLKEPVLEPNLKEAILEPNIKEPVPDPNLKEAAILEPNLKEEILEADLKEPVLEPNLKEPVLEPNQKEPVLEPNQKEPVLEPNQKEAILEPNLNEPILEPNLKEAILEPNLNEPVLELNLKETVIEPIPELNIKEPVLEPNQKEEILEPNIKEPVPDPNLKEPVLEPNLKEAILEPNLKEEILEADLKEPVLEPNLKETVLEPNQKEPVLEPNLNEPFLEPNLKEAILEPNLNEPVLELNRKETVIEPIPESNIKEPVPDPNLKEPVLEPNLKEEILEPNIKEPVPDPNLKEPVLEPNQK